MIGGVKRSIKGLFSAEKPQDSSLTGLSKRSYGFSDISYPAGFLGVHSDQLVEWIHRGMTITHEHYRRLMTELMSIEPKAGVMLLYNPSSYEIYRDILLDRSPTFDRSAANLVREQRDFAEKHGWIFLDLTDPLRRELKKNTTWIYGRYDGTHWSLKGTVLVAGVLATELLKVVESGETP